VRLHVDVLGRLHTVWGVFGALSGVSLGLLALGTAVSLGDQDSLGREDRAAVWVLVISAVVLAGVGASMIAVGSALRNHRPRARRIALVLAVPNLIVVPFGTALGIYTFWVLLNDDARIQFGRQPRAARVGSVHEHAH